ncbi:hypothetical protein [Actinomadura madurae]|uniref:hypothetical protein n=1 Tax=Actinomadura madurae TaxID=1993 RepID=UPI0011BF8BE5|nr:hypothetical protein [Actinomadura madurae]
MSGDQRVRKPGDEAVLVAIKRPSRERRRALGRRALGRMGRAQWIVAGPLVAVVLFFVVALTVYPPLYVLFGTSVPGLVDEKGPLSAGDKFKALGIWIPWILILGFAVWAFVRQRVMRPYLAVDGDGVWPVFGGRIRDGLGWQEIAAIHVVAENAPTTVPAVEASPPFVEIFPTRAIDDSGSATPLAAMVVMAQPPVPRLRGKRYVIELAVPPDELGRAIDRFGAGKRLVLR